MKLLPLSLTLGLLLAAPVLADEEAEHAALRKIKAAYEEAVNTDALPKFEPWLGKDATGIMITDEEIHGFAEMQAYWLRIKALLGSGGSYTVKVNVDQTDLLGDVAVSRGTTDDTAKTARFGSVNFHSHWTAVLRKDGGEWKVLRLHGSMDPLENPFVVARAASRSLAFGGVGVVLGFVLGWLSRFVGRARKA